MLLTVRVKPKRKQPFVTELRNGSFVVAVSAPPVDGKANAAVIQALAAHLGVAPSRLAIVRGHSTRIKTIELAEA